jgi:PIN domain nuclease of toxin-antitoxin system
MKFLLDTHIFLWWIFDDSRLLQAMRAVIKDTGNQLFLSSASTWEMIIKWRLGRLELPEPPDDFIQQQLRINALTPLAITIEHTLHLAKLPNLHKDPFDRMLVAQASLEDLILLTDDPLVKQYQVKVHE